MTPVLSIIIPAYNAAAHIRQTLASVLAQTRAAHEIIVVDDGSTDATPDIVREFSATVYYIRQPNQGVAAARNRGFQASQGAWVAFLDADDLWMPEFEAEMLATAAIVNSQIGVICCALQNINVNGEYQGAPRRLGSEGILKTAQLLYQNALHPSASIIRREVFAHVGMFDPTLAAQEDWDLCLRIAGAGYAYYYLDKVLSTYRQTPGSRSRRLTAVWESNRRILERFYAQDNLGADVLALRAEAFARVDLAYAAELYRAGDVSEGEQALLTALRTHPLLLEMKHTYYEIACAEQPRGDLGGVENLDLHAGAQRLDTILAALTNITPVQRALAYKMGYLALTELAYQQSSSRQGLLYAWRGLRSGKASVVDRQLWLLMAQTGIGKRWAQRARAWLFGRRGI